MNNYNKNGVCDSSTRLKTSWFPHTKDYEIDQSDGGGFMTSKGRYVDRTEAMKIAYECGQVTKETAVRDDGNGQYGSLFSEDIY